MQTTHLPAVFGPDSKYKTLRDDAWADSGVDDRCWLLTIPCKVGSAGANLYIHGITPPVIGYTGSGAGVRRKLLAIPGVVSHQNGDVEFSVKFPPELLNKVAKVVKPRTKRVLSAENLAKLRAGAIAAASRAVTPAANP